MLISGGRKGGSVEVKEGTNLIAHFMNMVELSPEAWYDATTDKLLILGKYRPHSDWNELMQVVEKIHDECKLYSSGLTFFEGLTIFSTIEQVWEAVINLIQWYNQQPKL